MYTEHFGLNEKPFSISPDPRYLYLSQRHADALAHLVYGISDSGGFIQLTGEVGTGKTTLIRSLLGKLPEQTEIALILNPKLSTKQFLQSICGELRVKCVQRDTAKTLIDKLNAKLLALHAENRRVVLIVDEAQTMSPALLEQVRLLTNLETDRKKLLQIILIGQPELRDVLDRSDMRQIAQRITGRYHLESLDGPDTALYVAHRMKVAGGRPEIFSPRAVRKLYRLSRGLPRLINVIADRALLAAYSRDENRIGAGLVCRAADEVFGRTRMLRWWPWAAAAGFAVLLLVTGTSSRDSESTRVLELAAVDSVGQEAAADLLPSADEPVTDSAPIREPSLAEMLATTPTDAETALSALFALWGADYSDASDSACDQAAAQGLRCLALSSASIAELRALNRPIKMELASADGEPHHLLLLGLGDARALVWINGAIERVAIAELLDASVTEQLLLYRPAVTIAEEPLAEGAEGLAVAWLRTSLESVFAEAIESEMPTVFDAGLATAVSRYQLDRGLVADGVVGDRTLVSLQTDIGLIGVPLKTGVN